MKSILVVAALVFLMTLPSRAHAGYGIQRPQDYRACRKFLGESPKKRRADFIPGALSFDELLQECRSLVRKGLKRSNALERGAGRSGGGRYLDRCHDSGDCAGSFTCDPDVNVCH